MNIKDLLQDDALKELEGQIIMSFDGTYNKHHNYTDERCLLEVRRRIINHRVLHHQESLLPDIVEFNNALKDALREMYDKAFDIWKNTKDSFGFDDEVMLKANCYLGREYPQLHPVQGEDRQELWDAICDSGWNRLYESGVALMILTLPQIPVSFETFIGMEGPSSNWNEGLDQELTKDFRLINAFHHLFDHTDFAITDFIYCREFYYEINIETTCEIQESI